jgi:hypothetical protein
MKLFAPPFKDIRVGVEVGHYTILVTRPVNYVLRVT